MFGTIKDKMKNPLFILIGLITILIAFILILLGQYQIDEMGVYTYLRFSGLVLLPIGFCIFAWAFKEKTLTKTVSYIPALTAIIIGEILVFTIGSFIGILSISFGVCLGIFGWLNDGKNSWRPWANSILVLLSLTILLIAHLYPTSEIDAKISATLLGKETEVGLDGKLYLSGFDVSVGVEGGGLLGGMGAHNERFFVQGPGPELPEKLGMIMNSYKEKSYEVSVSTYDYVNGTKNYAKIEVYTHIDRVPLWVNGIDQVCTVKISVDESVGMKRVDVGRVWIEVWTDYDEEYEVYKTRKEVWSRNVDDALLDGNDSLKYTHEMTYETSKKRMGVVGRIDFTFTDVNGLKDENPREPFKSDGHPSPHNVYGATKYQAFKVLLMVMAFPMFIIAAILAVIGIINIIRNKRSAAKLILISGILIGAGLFFYWWGVNTLLDMLELSPTLDKLAQEHFTWKWPIYLPIPSAVMLIGTWFFVWKGGVIDPEKTEHEEKKEQSESNGSQ